MPPQELTTDDGGLSDNKLCPPSSFDKASQSGSNVAAGGSKENAIEQSRPLLQLGCDPSLASHRLLRSSTSLAGLRYAEVLEWLAARRLSSSRPSMASSLTNMLGLGEGDKKVPTVARGTSVEKAAANTPLSATEVSYVQKNEERFRRARVALCPLKLRLALLLCDHGFVRHAEEYVKEIRMSLNSVSRELSKFF